MKKFEGLKKAFFAQKIARTSRAMTAVFALFAATGFFSCDNMSGGGSDPAPQAAPTQTAPTATSNPTAPTAGGQDIYVVIKGTVGVDGALPQEVSANVAALEDSIAAGGDLQLVSKSAEPGLNVNGTDYYYYVVATPQDSVGNTPVVYGKAENTGEGKKFNSGENGITYELALKIGKWKIECGIKNSEDKPVLRDITDVIELTPTDSVVNKSFVAAPVSDAGNGSVLLYIDKGDAITIASAVARYKDSGGTEQSATLTTASTSDGDPAEQAGKLKLKLDSVAPGAYEMAISFYNTADPNDSGAVMVYQTVQTVNVLGGMKTDTWANGGGTDGNLITGSGSAAAFRISTAAVNLFKSTYLYVGVTGAAGAKAPSNANEGSAYAPFATLQKAIDTIEENGNSTADYTVYVCGTLSANTELSADLDTKARSLTLQNLDGAEAAVLQGGMAKPASANENDPLNVLSVMTKVPVRIKGIKITKNSSLAADVWSRGILVKASDASVTLLGGTEVSGNTSGDGHAGGGVRVQQGSLVINGATITGNDSQTSGGGVYVENGAKATMTSGEISGNTAPFGGAVYNEGTLEISGSASIPYGADKKNDVYLAENKTVEVGSLGGSGVVATITPHSWARNASVLKASSSIGGTMTPEICGRFEISSEGFSVKKSKLAAEPNMGVLAADIFVSPASAGGDDGDTVEGTKAHPFKTLARAVRELSGGAPETIWINGTLTASSADDVQKIPATLDTSKCSALTIKGFDSQETYKAVINANNKGIALTVETAVPITIENLKITGGNTRTDDDKSGGGITVKAGSVTLSDRAWVTGNTGDNNVKCGGGVYVAAGAKFFMRGKSLVGDKNIASAPTSQGAGSNTVTFGGRGGGICNYGSAFIGCDESGAATSACKLDDGYGIIGNWSNSDAGGVYNQGALKFASGVISCNMAQNIDEYTGSGGGIYQEGGTLLISGGKICGNAAAEGGGLYVNGGQADMTGGAIGGDSLAEGNVATAQGANGCGGGVCVASGKTFTMTGGSISCNKANIWGGGVYTSGVFDMQGGTMADNSLETGSIYTRAGGAVYVSGTFKMSGKPQITYGGAEKKNDVYLASNKTITVGAFDTDATVATITLANWKRKTNFLTSSNAISTAQTDRFNFSYDNDGWDKTIKPTDGKSAYINSPIYVVNANDPDDSGKTRPSGFNKGNDSGATGTKTKPYATIAGALGCNQLSLTSNTITVAGTLGAQSIPDTTTLASGVTAVTITGYRPVEGQPSAAKISGGGTATALSMAKSGLSATIQYLTITDGSATNGGGINISNGTVKLANFALITGNTATDKGGGVYLAGSDASLFMYGAALIGDSATSTTRASSASGYFANKAANGAGIYNNGGAVYIGYDTSSHKEQVYFDITSATKSWYGVRRNYSTTSGAGAGIYHAAGTLQIASGDISHNNAGSAGAGTCNGGGIYCAADATVSGGTFTNNYASNGGGIYIASGKKVTVDGAAVFTQNKSWVNGGAVYNAGEFTMSAGTIGGSDSSDANSATGTAGLASYGGAIYQNGTFNISGSAIIYAGSEKTNDVYLATNARTITVGSLSGSGTVASVSLKEWKRGTNILSASSSISDTVYNRFVMSKDNDGWDRGNNDTDSTTKYVYITSPIYVASTATTDSARKVCSAAPASGNNGTKTSPYATIADALGDSDLSNTSYTITIDGKLDSQTIASGTTVASGVTAVTIAGYKPAPTESVPNPTSAAQINGGATSTALTLSKSGLTTTIKDLTITNGKSTQGAGIKVTSGTLKLTDGAIVTENDASGGNGGGVFVSSGASLFMYGKALIGDDPKSTETAYYNSSMSMSISNIAENGAGIYNNGGSVYLGYSDASTTADLTSNATDGYYGVSRNYATKNGGGIYHAYGTLLIASGNVSYNKGASKAGAVYFYYYSSKDTETTLAAGTFKGNSSPMGGAFYIDTSKTVTLSGPLDISGNTAVAPTNGGTSYGGAVYNAGTLKITGNAAITGNSASAVGVSGGSAGGANGGAICNSGTLTITGSSAKINGNSATVTVNGSAYGGAIHNTGNFILAAGTIGESGSLNYVSGPETKGGAVFQYSAFIMKSSGTVFAGTGTGLNQNDVYLAKKSTDATKVYCISVSDGDLSSSSTAKITSELLDNGLTVIDGTKLATGNTGFSLTTGAGEFNLIHSGTLGKLDIGATIYVSESKINTSTGYNAGDDTTGYGTQKRPFATIQKAAQKTWREQAYTISVNGTLTATTSATAVGKGNLQTIPNDAVVKATSITLTGTNSATINANSFGRALTVCKAIPVTITNVKFTGGSTGNGGGIKIDAGTVKLGNGVVVTGNKASSNGGGVYVASGASLFMYGTALIGDTIAATATSEELTTSGTTGCANSAGVAGGGIYSAGSVYLGYDGISEGTPSPSALSNGVRRNYVKNTSAGYGGGIYSDGTLYIGSGNVSYNYSGTGGGGVSCQGGTFKLQGGTINRNQSVTGGGVYNNSNGFMYVSGSPTIGGSASGAASKTTGNYATSKGGGIYSKGPVFYGYTAWTSESVNTPDPSFGGKINQNYADDLGGGVYLASGGTIRINKGSVAYNYAGRGGGCYVASKGVFMMYGGTVSNNKAGSSGGGALYVETTNVAPVNLGLDASIPSSTQASTDNVIYLSGDAYICLVNGDLTTTDKIWITGAGDLYKETKSALSQGTSGLIEANYAKFGALPYGGDDWIIKSDGKMAKVVKVTLSSSNMSTFTPVAGTTYNIKVNSSVDNITELTKRLFVKADGYTPGTIGANSVLDLSASSSIVSFGSGTGIGINNRVVQPFKKVILSSGFTEANLNTLIAAWILEGVEEIEVPSSSTTLCSVDGVVYNKDKTKIIQYPGNKPGETFTLPTSVTEIGASAFCCVKNLKTMTLTNKVTKINNYAFQKSSIETITIAGNVSTFGNEVFTNSTNLKTVSFTGTSCSFTSFYRTFMGCTALTTVTIPASVTSITSDAFTSCTKLTSATFKNTSGWKAGGTEVDVSTAAKGATVIKNAATNNKSMSRS